MQDTDNGYPVILGKIEDQIVAVRQVSQVWGKIGPLRGDLRILRKETEPLIKLITELSGCNRVIRRDKSNYSFQVSEGNALETKRWHYCLPA